MGPECPLCGCPETVVVREPNGHEWFGDGQAQCDNCDRVFTFKEKEETEKTEDRKELAVVWNPVRCPDCNSSHAPVYRTMGRVRYHKCRDCLRNFKSVEKEE
jgi:hypothetical protein